MKKQSNLFCSTHTQEIIRDGRIPVDNRPVKKYFVTSDGLNGIELDFRFVVDHRLHYGHRRAVVVLAVAKVGAVVGVAKAEKELRLRLGF